MEWYEIAPKIIKYPITASKSDLSEAKKYYHPKGKSEFAKVLNQMLKQVGEQNLKCKALPICSFEKDFEWNENVVKTNIGGEDNRKALALHFFETIAKLYE